MIAVRRFEEENIEEWDSFVRSSKNGTFLFLRGYMGYHADRFADHSLMFYEDNKLLALLPAHEADRSLYSHFGLSYGGLVMNLDCTAAAVIEIFRALKHYLVDGGFTTLYYKRMPWCYHTMPSEEDLYAMNVVFDDVKMFCRDLATLLVRNNMPRWRKDRRRALKRAQANGVEVTEQTDFAEFWQLLTDHLAERHNAKPVHSLEEIVLLRNRFPENIKLFEARQDGKLLGGLVVYVTKQVLRGQYSSTSPEGKTLGAMEAIKDYLLNDSTLNYQYFDFGTSSADTENHINESLVLQKEGFGGRGIVYDTYKVVL